MARLNLLILPMLLAANIQVPGQSWEPIDTTDYHNVRGFNYILSYQAINAALNPPAAPSHVILDVASAEAMWAAYDWSSTQPPLPVPAVAEEVGKQLDRMRDIGINTIRVWLSHSFYAWNPAGQCNPTGFTMAQKFGRFLDQCDQRHLYVIPILWDDVGAAPDLTSFCGMNNSNFMGWKSNPGPNGISASGALTTSQNQFVIDMVTIGSSHPCVLMWDVFNEPKFTQGEYGFIKSTLNLIKTTHSQAVTTVSPALWAWINAINLRLCLWSSIEGLA